MLLDACGYRISWWWGVSSLSLRCFFTSSQVLFVALKATDDGLNTDTTVTLLAGSSTVRVAVVAILSQQLSLALSTLVYLNVTAWQLTSL
jgi:hypothetical protein